MGNRVEVEIGSLSICANCKMDLCVAPKYLDENNSGHRNLIQFSALLEHALIDGYVELPNSGPLFSEIFLSGVESVSRILLSSYNDVGEKFQERLLLEGYTGADSVLSEDLSYIQLRRLGILPRRAVAFQIASLFGSGEYWPHRFLEIARSIKLRPSTLKRDRNWMPYWFMREFQKCGVLYAPWKQYVDPSMKGLSCYNALSRNLMAKALEGPQGN